LPTQSLEFYEGVIKQTDASSALMRQQLSEATAENLELQRLIMNQDVHKHETDTKLRIMEVSASCQRHTPQPASFTHQHAERSWKNSTSCDSSTHVAATD
jgi:hypothetical protein